MHRSVEEGCLISVIEEDTPAAAHRLREYMSTAELLRFREHVSTLLDLINAEVSGRSWEHHSSRAADTGEINIVRGRE